MSLEFRAGRKLRVSRNTEKKNLVALQDSQKSQRESTAFLEECEVSSDVTVQ